MLIQRAITAVILLLVFAGALLFLPNRYWALLLLGGLVIAAREWAVLARFGRGAGWVFTVVVGASGVAFLLGGTEEGARAYGVLYWLAVAFWALIVPVWLARGWDIRNRIALAAAGWLVLVPAWLALVELQSVPFHLLALLGIVWVADTAAYLVGRRLGRRPLAPRISPRKTWEGVYGAIAAVAMYYLILRFAAGTDTAPFGGLEGILLFILITAAGIVGDLYESWMKRQAGVKDSGALLPGHGGVLDRIDALTASLPLGALALLYLH